MRIHPTFVVCAVLALGWLGCTPVAHVELADGTIVSFVQPERGGEEQRHGKNAEGRFVTTVRMDCTATRQVGLAGEVLVRSAQRRDEEGYFHRDDSSTFRLTNVSDKPIALKRFLAYAHLPSSRKEQPEELAAVAPEWEEPVTCDPEQGFSNLIVDHTRYEFIRAKEPGFTYRLILMAQPWHLEGDLLVQPLPTMSLALDHPVEVPVRLALAAPGAEAILRPLGGGKPFASLPIKPQKEGDTVVKLRFTEGIPPMMPLEVCFKAAPDVPASGWLISPRKIEKHTPIYALEGAKDLNCTLAPGESLTFTLLYPSVRSPDIPVKKDN